MARCEQESRRWRGMSRAQRSASTSATAAATSPTTSTWTRWSPQWQADPDVVVAKTAMFTCSDATQQEIIKDIQEQNLDGIVVASCSPKLHTFTFREVAKRAGLNPYQYTQVNIREQCSWTHTDDHAGATEKAAQLVKAGIGRTRLTVPLEPIVVETVPKAVVIGGGITGLRAALGLAEIGLAVFLVEKEARARRLGGRLRRDVPPRQERPRADRRPGREGAGASRHHRVHRTPRSSARAGSFGNYRGGHPVRTPASRGPRPITGAGRLAHRGHRLRAYRRRKGEFGYGLDGRAHPARVQAPGRRAPTVRSSTTAGRSDSIVYIYCVGSRQPRGQRVLLALLLHGGRPRLAAGGGQAGAAGSHQYHLLPRHPHLRQVRAAVRRVARQGLGVPALPRRRAAGGARRTRAGKGCW